MAKLGYLYLRGGLWEGKQIIPASWVKASLEKQVDPKMEGEKRSGYGYLWWVGVGGKLFPGVTVDDGAFAAEGVGGNYIVAIPSRKLVIVHRVKTAAGRKVTSAEFGQLLALILGAKTGN